MNTGMVRPCVIAAAIAALGGCASAPMTSGTEGVAQPPLATPGADQDGGDIAWLDGCDIYTRASDTIAVPLNIPEVILTYDTASGGNDLLIEFTGEHGAKIVISLPPDSAGTTGWSPVLVLSTSGSTGNTLRIRDFDKGPDNITAAMANAWSGARKVPAYWGTALPEPNKPRVRIVPIDGTKGALYIEYRNIVARFLVKGP